MRRLGCSFLIFALLMAPASGWAANACQVSGSEANALIEKFLKDQGVGTETRTAARAAPGSSYKAVTVEPAALRESKQITSTVKSFETSNRDLQQALRASGNSPAFIQALKAEIPPGKGLMRVVSPEEAENIIREGGMGSGYDFGMKPGDVRLGHSGNYIIVRCAECSDIKFEPGDLGSSQVNMSKIPASKLEFIVLKPQAAEQEAVARQGEELLARAENPNMKKTVLTLVERCKQDHENCESSLAALQKMADHGRFRAAQLAGKPVVQENLPEVNGVKFKDSRIAHAFEHRAEFGITDDSPESLAKFRQMLEEQIKSPDKVLPAIVQYKDGRSRQLLAYLKGDRVVVVDANTKELLTAYRPTPANYDALIKEGRLLTGTTPKVRAQIPYSRPMSQQAKDPRALPAYGLNDDARVEAAEKGLQEAGLLKGNLTLEQRELIRDHLGAGQNTDYFLHTKSELRQKIVNGRKAGLSLEQSDYLIRNGYAGQSGELALATVSKESGANALRSRTYGPTREEQKILDSSRGNFFVLPKRDPEAAAQLNRDVLESLKNEPLPEGPRGTRKAAFDRSDIQQLWKDANENKQVRESLCGSYNGSPSGYGFCWGRAMAVHLKAIQDGVSNRSIRKVWAVGDLKSGQTNWRYHVTTIVRTENGGWYAIDPIFGKPMPVRDWYVKMRQDFDPNGTMRIFSSPASRFGPEEVNKYNKQELARDYYYGFFKDLLDTISRENTGRGWSAAVSSPAARIAVMKKILKGAGITLGPSALAALADQLHKDSKARKKAIVSGP